MITSHWARISTMSSCANARATHHLRFWNSGCRQAAEHWLDTITVSGGTSLDLRLQVYVQGQRHKRPPFRNWKTAKWKILALLVVLIMHTVSTLGQDHTDLYSYDLKAEGDCMTKSNDTKSERCQWHWTSLHPSPNSYMMPGVTD